MGNQRAKSFCMGYGGNNMNALLFCGVLMCLALNLFNGSVR